MFEKIRQWRIGRLELKLADQEYHLDKWGWSNTPSEGVYERKRIKKTKAKLARLKNED